LSAGAGNQDAVGIIRADIHEGALSIRRRLSLHLAREDEGSFRGNAEVAAILRQQGRRLVVLDGGGGEEGIGVSEAVVA